MITVSPAAVDQIKLSAQQSNAEGLALRIAIHQKEDKSFHYVMGFDENEMDGDVTVETDGVKVVIDSESQKLAAGLKLDYINLEGNMEFVFLNPNDPAYRPPKED